MPTTIGHLQLIIGATNDKLQRDMRKNEQIVDKSGKKMVADMNKRGTSLWGSFFRGSFLLSQFKKLTQVLRQGSAELTRTGDAGAAAAAGGLKEYDDAMNKIAATAARSLAPALGKVATFLADTTSAFEDLIDVYQFEIFGDGLDAELRRRDEIQRKLEKKRANFDPAGDMQAFMKKQAPVKAALQDLVTPLEKFIELTDRARLTLMDGAQAEALFQNELKKLIGTLGLAVEVDPFAKWGESLFELSKLAVKGKISFKDLASIVQSSGQQLIKSSGLGIDSAFGDFQKKTEQLNQLRRAGAIGDAQFFQMLGNQTEKLLGDRIQNRLSIQPNLMERGSAEALGTIAAFRAPQATEADFEKELLRLQKEEAERDKRQEKLGIRIAKATEKFANIAVVGNRP